MNDDDSLLASEWVLGLVEPADRPALEARLRDDSAFAAAVAAWQTHFAELEDVGEAGGAAELWSRIESRLDAEDLVPGTVTITADQGVWETIAAGVEQKVVHVDSVAKSQAFLVRMKAGAVLMSHDHPQDEHCVVIQGELKIAGSVFGAGTYHLAAKGHPHPRIKAASDALFFIHGAL